MIILPLGIMNKHNTNNVYMEQQLPDKRAEEMFLIQEVEVQAILI